MEGFFEKCKPDKNADEKKDTSKSTETKYRNFAWIKVENPDTEISDKLPLDQEGLEYR